MSLNPKRLTKHYDKLTPRERFSLIVAAGVRGDEAEQDHLTRSAPRKTFSVASHQGYAEGFAEVGNLYLVGQLETGIGMWRVLSVFEAASTFNPRLALCLARFANRFLVQRRAWRLLCEEYGVDGDAVLGIHPSWNTVQDLEELAETFALWPEQAAVWVREREEEACVVTVEEIREWFKETVEERARRWL